MCVCGCIPMLDLLFEYFWTSLCAQPVYRQVTYICKCIYINICIYISISIDLSIYPSFYICICIIIYIHVYIYVYVYVYVCIYINTYKYICMCVCVCIPMLALFEYFWTSLCAQPVSSDR